MHVGPLLNNSPPVGEQLLIVCLTFRSILGRRQRWLLNGQFFCIVSSVRKRKRFIISSNEDLVSHLRDSPEAVVSVKLVVTADSDLKVRDAKRTGGGGAEAGIQL